MTYKLAIIHTTPVTVESLKGLAKEILPPCEIVNFVDDSILPQLSKNGGNVSEVEERLVQYARFAEQVGADIILSACSSVGEVAEIVQSHVKIPVVRIDESMAEEAIRRGEVIGVAATLSTTLAPTVNLLHAKAQIAGKQIELHPVVADEAYQQLLSGNTEKHDEILAEVLGRLVEQVDVVVLAQASMARVLKRLPDHQKDKFLTSPVLAMEKIRHIMKGIS